MVFYKCLITNTLSLMRSILGLPAQSLSRGGASAPLFNFPMQTKAKQGVAKPHLNATAWPHSKDAPHQNSRAEQTVCVPSNYCAGKTNRKPTPFAPISTMNGLTGRSMSFSRLKPPILIWLISIGSNSPILGSAFVLVVVSKSPTRPEGVEVRP